MTYISGDSGLRYSTPRVGSVNTFGTPSRAFDLQPTQGNLGGPGYTISPICLCAMDKTAWVNNFIGHLLCDYFAPIKRVSRVLSRTGALGTTRRHACPFPKYSPRQDGSSRWAWVEQVKWNMHVDIITISQTYPHTWLFLMALTPPSSQDVLGTRNTPVPLPRPIT
ncbi:hypothetical protein BGZ63DRAFT_404029 [Mariannaea sp. PMI_226]|nr:hypothetical protein BGZ63DRAFT_404029 [Mariannaea sp. PMI_226]